MPTMPLPPGGPQQVRVPLKQVIYPSVQITVQTQNDGSRLLIVDTPQGEQLVFPMSEDAAKAIGSHLTAPSVVVPNGNGHR